MSQFLTDADRGYAARYDEEHDNGARSTRHLRNVASGGANAENGGANAENGAGSGSSDRPGEAGNDATLAALDGLRDALESLATDHQLLEERLKGLHRERAEGRSWREILSAEDPPGTMQLVSRMLACLAKASGTLRKELVESLRHEGVSIPAIAKLFGVTHQRVSNLLRRPAE